MDIFNSLISNKIVLGVHLASFPSMTSALHISTLQSIQISGLKFFPSWIWTCLFPKLEAHYVSLNMHNCVRFYFSIPHVITARVLSCIIKGGLKHLIWCLFCHQAPFWVFVVVRVVVLGNQAVTRGKNKLPHAHYTSDPKDFIQILKAL